MKITPRYFPVLILALTICVDLWASAGREVGSGGGRVSSSIKFIISVLCFGYVLWTNFRISRKRQQVSEILKRMASKEPVWSESNLNFISQKLFLKCQKAWGEQDLKSLKEILHPILYPSWETNLKEQKKENCRTRLQNISIGQNRIVDVQNYLNDEYDSFTVCFDAKGDIEFIQDGAVKKVKNVSFREFWTFELHRGRWTVFEVTPASGWKRFVSSQVVYEQIAKKAA